MFYLLQDAFLLQESLNILILLSFNYLCTCEDWDRVTQSGRRRIAETF
tara:strand:+ start:292 stop:435 length:144 start_codon:yes stop_codon:yes gene_type:complete